MKATTTWNIQRIRNGQAGESTPDLVVTESPLEILIGYSEHGVRRRTAVAATMRTPGDDFNLVAGWLFCEGMIQSAADLLQVKYAGNTDTVLADLAPHVPFDPTLQSRQFPISSACGWCGRYADRGEQPNILARNLQISAAQASQLPELLRTGQGLFSDTGGAHAVALLDEQGTCLLRCEDVGRHNAMDKLIGAMLRAGKMPLNQHFVVFSGRLGYELVQKSLAAGIQLVAALGAPSSAALELAEAYGMTVLGFVKSSGFNCYTGKERVLV